VKLRRKTKADVDNFVQAILSNQSETRRLLDIHVYLISGLLAFSTMHTAFRSFVAYDWSFVTLLYDTYDGDEIVCQCSRKAHGHRRNRYDHEVNVGRRLYDAFVNGV
jgi:hypothetical protein